MKDWSDIISAMSAALDKPIKFKACSTVSGGCINQAWKLVVSCVDGEPESEPKYFIKTNKSHLLPMFEAESQALEEIYKTGTVRVPRPLATGVASGQSWIVMEYISMETAGSASTFGTQLACMHRHTATRYGWHRDNTIGSTQQSNKRVDCWSDFWREERIGFQLQLARSNGYGGRLQSLGNELLRGLDDLFAGYRPEASLLHGDLWGGNWSGASGGEPVMFDPASYYGDRETDIAMTELFGGFDASFYQAYEQEWALDQGYRSRRPVYNLYHVLNHLNLFGGGYGRQAESIMTEILSH